jgi:hypothetical protein
MKSEKLPLYFCLLSFVFCLLSFVFILVCRVPGEENLLVHWIIVDPAAALIFQL